MTRNVARQRSLPTPRTEGMKNVLEATLRLLDTTNPKDVTLRDVARESGHGPRLIIEWFGGKGGLFAAVCIRTFEDLAATGDLFYSDIATRPELRAVVRIFNFMQVNHPEFVEQVRTDFIYDIITDRLMTVRGFTKERAGIAARRILAHTMGLGIVAEFHGLSDDVVIQMTQAEVTSSMGFELADNPNRVSREL